MLKKIAFLLMLTLPMGAMAQDLKFGHMNSMDIIPTMPEYTKAMNELEALQKQYTEELQRTQEEFGKKYQEFQQAMASNSLPENIAERRQKELEDMAQRQQQFQQEAEAGMQKAQQEKMSPIYNKLDNAIKAVGEAEGVIYVFDMARTQIPYIGAKSVDLTAKVKAHLGISNTPNIPK